MQSSAVIDKTSFIIFYIHALWRRLATVDHTRTCDLHRKYRPRLPAHPGSGFPERPRLTSADPVLALRAGVDIIGGAGAPASSRTCPPGYVTRKGRGLQPAGPPHPPELPGLIPGSPIWELSPISGHFPLFAAVIITASNGAPSGPIIAFLRWGGGLRPRPCYAQPSKKQTLTRCWFNVGPASWTVDQSWPNIGWMPRVFALTTNHSAQNICKMLGRFTIRWPKVWAIIYQTSCEMFTIRTKIREHWFIDSVCHCPFRSESQPSVQDTVPSNVFWKILRETIRRNCTPVEHAW